MRSERSRLPVAAKIALTIAGAIDGVPGSPTPPGAWTLGRICTSSFDDEELVSFKKTSVVRNGAVLTSKASQQLLANVSRANKLGRLAKPAVRTALAKIPELRDRFGNIIQRDFCIADNSHVAPNSVKVASLDITKSDKLQ